MGFNRPQYNNNGNYPKKSYNNNNSSNGGTAEMIKTKKDGVILKVILNNQNLVLKGFFDSVTKGWKLFPYYDKTKQNPQFNKPKPRNDMDDQLPQSEQEWSQGSATDFNPDEYEQQLGNE